MKPRIAFFSDRPPERMEPYMRGDWDTLASVADLTWFDSSTGRGWHPLSGPAGWMPTVALCRALKQCDLAFQWFATPLAPVLAARLLRKPAIVVAGGYDVAFVPEIRYGLMVGRRTRLMTRLTLSLADRVLCVSRSTEIEVQRWAPRASAVLLYHGLEPSRYRFNAHKRPKQVVTVGCVSAEYLWRKGLQTFAETARLLPEARFLLIGRHVEPELAASLKAAGGANIELTGHLPEDRLLEILSESAVYAQLSLHEGFGYALAEAMLCGCTPVGTRRGALPEVIGDCGFYVEAQDPAEAAAAIRAAFENPRATLARERISSLFPADRRRDRLLRHVREVLSLRSLAA